MCWVLAIVLYRVGVPGSVARKLALLLVVESITLITGGFPLELLGPEIRLPLYQDPVLFQVSFVSHTLGDCLMLALYPIFLAAALHTRPVRHFGRKPWPVILFAVAGVIFAVVQITPWTIGATILYAALSLLFGFSLIASIHAWRTAARGGARTRAGIFALAFGVRDLCWGFVYASAIWRIAVGTYTTEEDPAYIQHIYILGTFLYVPVLAYGILRTQLFDIDLKIRWTIKQSTVAAIFVAIMFLISEGASLFLEAELGPIAGLIAGAVVVFFLAPLQRFADRVASAAMPNTQNTPEYATYRKMQVYEAAVSEAMQEGGISAKERSLLVRLRDSLDIAEPDAMAIEGALQDVESESAGSV